MAATAPTSPAPPEPRRLSPGRLGLLLGGILAVLFVYAVRSGSTGLHDWDTTWQGVSSLLGFGDPLPGSLQTIVELRLFRALVALGVGAALALSGGLLQGVFRNDLASPSIIGVSAGAALGASLAILVIGGYGPQFFLEEFAGVAPLFVSAAAFLFALGTVWLVTRLATTGGRISVPTLLLTGIALNAIISGLLAAIQSLVLQDYEVARAIISWTFGTLDDRTGYHVALIWTGVALSASVIPFVSVELDLFAGGEDDARSLGVHTQRTKNLALLSAALAAGVAVAVAGQIAFLGLTVPHLLRMLVGRGHRALLPLCLLGGPTFLLGADLAQRWLLGTGALQPGVVMSLIGGPFFLFLLVRNRAKIQAW